MQLQAEELLRVAMVENHRSAVGISTLSVIFPSSPDCFSGYCHFRLWFVVEIAEGSPYIGLIENARFAVGISILSVIVPRILTFLVLAVTAYGCKIEIH